MTYIQKLQQQISIADGLITRVSWMVLTPPKYVCEYVPTYGMYGEKGKEFEDEVNGWFNNTLLIIKAYSGDNDPYVLDFAERKNSHIHSLDFREGMISKVKSGIRILNNIIDAEHLKEELGPSSKGELEKIVKPPKVFISHKTEDEAYADALTNLINFVIGADGDKLFCSSISGYGIKPSQDIIDEIKAQFENYNLFVIIIHSPRYYKSAVCLNEMGAAWALNTKFCSFLTKDCRIDQLTGVIGKEEICISPNADVETLNAHLNSFKDELAAFFGSKPIDQTKWEHERKQFVQVVSEIKDADVPGEARDLFDTIYLPTFDTIFELLDVDHFYDWAYLCALDGNTILLKRIYEAMGRTIAYIRSRPKHKEYANWDSLIQNLGLLLSDFKTVFSCHSDSMGSEAYTVVRFYKYGPLGQSFNPNYDTDLKAYEEHVCLISDLLFELTRLGNLILTRIRDIHPEYKQELGILYIDDRVNTPDLVYHEGEICDAPYPGIEKFISVRLSREKHYGTSGTINVDGYEKDNTGVYQIDN